MIVMGQSLIDFFLPLDNELYKRNCVRSLR